MTESLSEDGGRKSVEVEDELQRCGLWPVTRFPKEFQNNGEGV